MSKSETITVTLTGPQYQEVMAALDLRIQTLMDDQYPQASQQAAVAERAMDRMRTAWQRAVDGF